MKINKLFFGTAAISLVMATASCGGGKQGGNTMNMAGEDSVETAADSTIYGLCGDDTSMHILQLVKADGDTLEFNIDVDEPTSVLGGMMAGDRMAVVGKKNADGGYDATMVINLTTLQGRWTSIDKNFDIKDGGLVKSNVKAETDPWVSWKIYNGKLVFNDRDTFTIDELGADSLYMENKNGIFTYRRGK